MFGLGLGGDGSLDGGHAGAVEGDECSAYCFDGGLVGGTGEEVDLMATGDEFVGNGLGEVDVARCGHD